MPGIEWHWQNAWQWVKTEHEQFDWRPIREMSMHSPESVTQLLAHVQSGRSDAWDQIYAALYDDLHRIARAQIRLRPEDRMSATSLVCESWLRLADGRFNVESRRHFVSLVARAMRFVLVDATRRDMAGKRVDGGRALSLDESVDAAREEDLVEIIAMDAALTRLEQLDARLGRLVEMRYFGGMDEAEIAAVLGVTDRTLRRDWRKARAFLLAQMDASAPAGLQEISRASPR